jgi:hypothetical protein
VIDVGLPPSLISTMRAKMKEADRQRVQRCLQWIDTWRASGTQLKDWCALHGEELAAWRGRLRWERRWRHGVGQLSAAQFVRALPPPKVAPTALTALASVRIEIGPGGAGLRASVELPLSALPGCAAWLREVLA